MLFLSQANIADSDRLAAGLLASLSVYPVLAQQDVLSQLHNNWPPFKLLAVPH
jgi:hypothetical protein